MLFIRFLNSGADTPATKATKTQFRTITGSKYKMNGNIYRQAHIAIKWFEIDFKAFRQSCHIDNVKD